MKKGLVLGKFLPFHNGHVALIDLARQHCDEVTVIICVSASESIPGAVRFGWLRDYYSQMKDVRPVLLEYDENELPNTSVSSRETSRKWANFLKRGFDTFDLVYSSEEYGAYLADYLGATHVPFDPSRQLVPVSGTEIRKHPFKFWTFLPSIVRPHFVKKICLIGTESTGKSTLAERLAGYFETTFVSEMARDVIEQTAECRPEHLPKIAELHAKQIEAALTVANRFLFVDTDVNITRSYSRFLFKSELHVPAWIDAANRCDLYLFLENDCDYIQDGTRLQKSERDQLAVAHRQLFDERRIDYVNISGGWEEKFRKAIDVIQTNFKDLE